MNRKTFLVTIMVMAAAGAAFAGNGWGRQSDGFAGSGTLLEGIASSDLSAAEIEGLLLMREEEKLARDVYTTLGGIWELRVFENIAGSEQTHMDSVKELLDRYGIEDPVESERPGTYRNIELAELYGELIIRGSRSIQDALAVGALIEELDIADLRKLIASSDNEDIDLVYANLLAGSENHLRAFVSQLDRYGVSFEPKYLSSEEVAEILSKTRGNGWIRA